MSDVVKVEIVTDASTFEQDKGEAELRMSDALNLIRLNGRPIARISEGELRTIGGKRRESPSE